MMRIRTAVYVVSHSQVLGVGDHAFRLKKGDEIEVYDRDKYNRVRVVIQETEVLINGTMLDRVANEKLPVHYVTVTGPGMIIGNPVLCGDMTLTGAGTQDKNRVTCERCLAKLREKQWTY